MPLPAALALAVAHTRLSAIDLALVALYLAGITLFGLRFRKRGHVQTSRSLKDYFLADNTIPWWAISLSIVSAETSTLTVISIPGVAFAGNFGFLQIVLGYLLGRVVISAIFLPRYFAGEMLTAYQLIDRRFGGALHKVTAALFLVMRAAAEGVRVFAVSIVVAIAIGTGNVASIAIISALTLLYTFEGGMAAVVWTDVVQMAIYIGGTLIAIATLGTHVDGGWGAIHTVAGAAGKFHMLNFSLNLTQSYTFWAGVLGGTFLTMASHGTDQLMVQRMLAARNLRESRLALLSSGGVIFLQFALFLLIGAGLFVFYGQHPGTTFRTNDYIFPTFIVREMPVGVAGILIAAILAAAMSNLSAALNSLSSTTVVDFYMQLRPGADDRERAIISKASTVLWAMVLFGIAVYSVSAGGKGHVVEIGLSISAVAWGCMLGVFLLGTLTRFASQTGAIIGMVFGFALNLWLWKGTFPVRLGPITIPTIAFTWYVLIGAAATFLIGALMSLIFRNKRTSSIATTAILLLLLAFPKGECRAQAPAAQPMRTAYDFSAVSALVNAAVADHKLPGAVVIVGHDGHVLFHQAYGARELAGEPGLDGKPLAAADPMTEDTIFDMASLTKCLATATAVMQLYDAHKLASFDDPVEKYLPAFNADHDPVRAKVTVRMLLTHTSGEAPDISLKDAWGLAAPDKAEGFHRALSNPLANAPGAKFVYSDINFILLGDLVETLSGQPEDEYVQQHVFAPLGMLDTRYLPLAKVCGPHKIVGAAVMWAPAPPGRMAYACPPGTWSSALLARIAPTTHDDESKSNPALNPHWDMLTRGTVHDPTTRRMGGVAGHAGVFSTANDVATYAQALLEKLLHNRGPFPVSQATLKLMTMPEQPGANPQQIAAAQIASDAQIKCRQMQSTTNEAEILHHCDLPPGKLYWDLAPAYPAIKGQDLRGYGWDIDTAFSKPRGMIFPIGSFGHTGFTGTTLWMDPASDTYVVLLANAIHPRGGAPISNLRGEVATAVAQALEKEADCHYIQDPGLNCDHIYPDSLEVSPVTTTIRTLLHGKNALRARGADTRIRTSGNATLTGIDVLEATHFSALAPFHHIGILTNQTGLDRAGKRTIDLISAARTTDHGQLTTIFTPEHGLSAKQDTTKLAAESDTATGVPVISLYGVGDASRRPKHEQLAGLDAVVVDLPIAGVRFWTYQTAMHYFLQAAAKERDEFHHTLTIVVLDRPNIVGGLAVQGPVSDPTPDGPIKPSYIGSIALPIRHGMTLGELARYMNGHDHLNVPLTVVPMQHWSRAEFYDETGLPWIDPSPNLRTMAASVVYPGLGIMDPTNISVGRGTSTPFEQFGAGIPAAKPDNSTATGGVASATTGARDAQTRTGTGAAAWFHAADVAAALNARHIPGVTFTPTTVQVAEDANHYPYHGQNIEAVHLNVTDRNVLDSPEMGIEILSVLHHLYPAQFSLSRTLSYVGDKATFDAIERGDDPRAIAAVWAAALEGFKAERRQYLLY